MVLFTDDFLLDHPDDRALLRGLGPRPWLELDEEADAWTSSLVAEMYEEYRTGAEGFHGVIRALLHVLVVRAARLSARPVTPAVARASGVAGSSRPWSPASTTCRRPYGRAPTGWGCPWGI